MCHAAHGSDSGPEEEEEVRANLDRSAGRFRRIHLFHRSDTAASICCRPVALIQDQHRPNFPPDWFGVEKARVDDMAVIGRWHKYRCGGRALDLPEGYECLR